jgi:hypothetical protein
MEGFGRRITPQPVFESYTPTELALQRLTLSSATWTAALAQRMEGGTPLATHDLETHFRHYLDDRFPLRQVDPDDLADYVVEAERRKRRANEFSRQRREPWWHSHPSGQTNFPYPSLDYRGEAPSFDMARRR